MPRKAPRYEYSKHEPDPEVAAEQEVAALKATIRRLESENHHLRGVARVVAQVVEPFRGAHKGQVTEGARPARTFSPTSNKHLFPTSGGR